MGAKLGFPIYMFLPFFGKKSSSHLYTLLINESCVCSTSWHAQNGVVTCQMCSELFEWDTEDPDSLFLASDSAFSTIAQEGNQVLLSLPEDWVQGQGIHPKRKSLLKNLTERLELQSVGFVVTMEALLAFVQTQSTTPLHAICIGVERDALIVSVVIQGEIGPFLRVGRSGDSREDLLEACGRIKLEQLPSKILVFACSKENENEPKVHVQLSQGEWREGIFSNTPQVEYFDSAYVARAVTSAGGTEVVRSLDTVAVHDAQDLDPQQTSDFVPVQNESEIVHENAVVTQKKANKFLIAGLCIVLLLVILGVLRLTAHLLASVNIALTRSPLSVEKEVTVPLTLNSQSTSSATLVASSRPLTVSVETTVAATGKKDVGEYAKGTIALFNKTLQIKKFPKGTVVSTNGLKFTLDSDVTVASASSTITQTVNGKETVKVTAVAFGEAGNIQKDALLSVGTFDASAYVAQSIEAFSGGSSTSVVAVANKDLDTALAKLVEKAKTQMAEKFPSVLGSGESGVLFDDIALVEKKLSTQVGSEANELTVSARASSSALVYTKEQLQTFVQAQIQTDVQAGFSLLPNSLDIRPISQKKKSSTVFEQKYFVSAKTLSPIDTQKYSQIISGKTITEAGEFFEKQDAVSQYEFSYSPAFLRYFLYKLPSDPTKIEVIVKE